MAEKQALRGRPPLPEGEGRSRSLRVRMTRDEHAELSKGAEIAGETVSDFVRDRVLRAARRMIRDE